jgi:heat-inducible transcriptional repressor
MLAEMTDRRQQILKMVIQVYVETSAPVASEHLVRRYGLNVSSATIRNEFAALEEMGYLTHLHTSAGRIPTDAGYRFYVEHLIDQPTLSTQEQQVIRTQFYQSLTSIDQWIHLAGSVMARSANTISVVMPPRAAVARMRNMHIMSIHETLALIVIVFHDGMVRQVSKVLEAPTSQDDLQLISAFVNELCHDATVRQVRDRIDTYEGMPTLAGQVLEVVYTTMQQYEAALNNDIRADGILEMLSQPEFAQTERVKHMLELVQTGQVLMPFLPRVARSNGVEVFIGTEHQQPDMREISVVLARYGVDDDIVGVLGVVGPTRMPYSRAIATVKYIATVMSDLVGGLHGEPRPERSTHDTTS